MPFGLLNLNKPPGMSSRRAIDFVKHSLRGVKVGHAGTLDPLASGVLVVCVGRATRLIRYVQEMPKRYTATFLLGHESPTEDLEGEVTVHGDAPQPSPAQLQAACAAWTGEIMQRPPLFSAVKVAGQRAYHLARRGRAAEIEPRPVSVHGIDITSYVYPRLEVDIECGSGTYIRSLGRDIASSLGTTAVMSNLVRTAIGRFRLQDAVGPDQITPENVDQLLISAREAVASLPVIEVTPDEKQRLASGLYIERSMPAECNEAAAIGTHGIIVAIVTPRPGGMVGAAMNLGDGE